MIKILGRVEKNRTNNRKEALILRTEV